MIAVPADIPVRIPVPESIVATPVLALLHVPPPAASLREIPEPGHTDVAPVMVPELGRGKIVTVRNALEMPQPLETE
jgi:hypothetical protein